MTHKEKNLAILTKTRPFTTNKVTGRKLYTPIKDLEWNNTVFEVEKNEKKNLSPNVTHPVKVSTNSHPHLNKRERMGTREKKKFYTGSNKYRKKNKE